MPSINEYSLTNRDQTVSYIAETQNTDSEGIRFISLSQLMPRNQGGLIRISAPRNRTVEVISTHNHMISRADVPTVRTIQFFNQARTEGSE